MSKKRGMQIPKLQNSFVTSQNPSERILLSNPNLITVQDDTINTEKIPIIEHVNTEQQMKEEINIKNEFIRNPGSSNMITEQDNASNKGDNDNEMSPFKKFFQANKKRTVRRKEKKARQNRRLRKMLKPKTALMALNELASEKSMSHCKITPHGTAFIAEIRVNDKIYEGSGSSKVAAKNDASEKALRDLIILKMSRVPKQDVSIIHSNKGSTEDISMDGEDNKNDSSDEEDVPMLHLASFALHKLFTEWESAGFHIPDFKIANNLGLDGDGDQQMQKVEKLLGPVRTELPPNAETLHPCMLLAIMRPGITFTEISSEGLTPNITHKVGVTVDNKEYTGEARSKKLARKLVASQACAELFKVFFPEENYD